MTMSSSEIMDTTLPQIDKWFYEEAEILNACLKKEEEFDEIYGDGNYMCPFYAAWLELALVNIEKGWTKEELLRDLSDFIDNNQ